MVKTYGFEEFRWHFLSKEVDRFDLRKFYDKGRYIMRQVFREIEDERINEQGIRRTFEEKEVREGQIVRILRIENIKNCGSYGLRNSA